MRVSVRWLRELVPTELSTEAIAERLTLAGLAVEAIERIGEHWEKIFTGLVEAIEPHPNADRLVLATVAAGTHRLTVVTGAPNIAVGQKVALALPGATLYDGHSIEPRLMTLTPSTIRGIRSEGMVCSEKELGLSDDHEGIMVLPDDTPVGVPLADVLGDEVLEIEITPNLVHAFSMIGIARELGALTKQPVNYPALAELAPCGDPTLVAIDASDLCARFVGVVIEGVEPVPSPWWMQQRLRVAGMRPINAIVDITNYVMLEYGQPQHAYDRARLHGGRLIARRARPGETLETIDHVHRTLDPDTLVIADEERAVGIAGIMGGRESEIDEETRVVLLETANFDMRSIRRTARAQRLRTEASARFERGLDPNLAWTATRRAVMLFQQLFPQSRITNVADVYPYPRFPRQIQVPRREIPRLLGTDFSDDEILDVLHRLELAPEVIQEGHEQVIVVTVPTYRSDLTIKADIVEEIARVIGYDKLPERLPVGQTVPVEVDPLLQLVRAVQDTLVGEGLTEIITYPMIDEAALRALDPAEREAPNRFGFFARPDLPLVRAVNPIRPEWSMMRPSLLPTLLRAGAEHLKFNAAVSIFEVGKVYLPRGGDQLPDERRVVGCLLAGVQHVRDLYHEERPVDFFDLKGTIEVLLPRVGALDVTFRPLAHPSLHPGRAAEIVVKGEPVGVLGEVHPLVAEHYGIERHHRVVTAEIDLSALLALGLEPISVHPVSRFQPIEQDFAIVVDEAVPAALVTEAVRLGAGPLATNVRLFDVYRGPAIPAGKKSLAFRVTFSALDQPLSDEQLASIRETIARVVHERVGGALRQ